MRTTYHGPKACPHCQARMGAATHVTGDATPSPGDLTICVECLGLSRFADDLSPRTLTPDELAGLKASGVWPVVQVHRRALLRAKQRRPRPK